MLSTNETLLVVGAVAMVLLTKTSRPIETFRDAVLAPHAFEERPPRRVLSQAELQHFTTTRPTGEIVMAGSNGVIIDQGNQAINVTPTDIIFYAGAVVDTEVMRIKQSGNIGVGTTASTVKMTVQPGTMLLAGSTANLGFNDGYSQILYNGSGTASNTGPANGLGVFGYADGMLGTVTGGSKGVLFWNSSGNVGVGNTNPAYNLDISGDINLSGTLYNNGTPYTTLPQKNWATFMKSITKHPVLAEGAYGGVAISKTGQYQYATSNGELFRSQDYGSSFAPVPALSGRNVNGSIALSDNGQYVLTATVTNPGVILTSNDYGVTWTTTSYSSVMWGACAMSANGKYQMFAVYSYATASSIYRSADYGATFTVVANSAEKSWNSITCSSSGQYQYAVSPMLASVSVSSDYGVTWTKITSPATCWDIKCSGNGKIVYATMYSSVVRVSTNYGITWANTSGANVGVGGGYLSCSTDGSTVLCSVTGGYLYLSQNAGSTWTQLTSTTMYWTNSVMSQNGDFVMLLGNSSAGALPTVYASIVSSPGITTTGMINVAGALKTQLNTVSLTVPTTALNSGILSTSSGVTTITVAPGLSWTGVLFTGIVQGAAYNVSVQWKGTVTGGVRFSDADNGVYCSPQTLTSSFATFALTFVASSTTLFLGTAGTAAAGQTIVFQNLVLQRVDTAVTGNLTTGGYVGIGTTNPAYALHVYGNVSASGLVCGVKNTAADGYPVFVLANDGAYAGIMFLNGSTRTLDGGANTMTVRNDAGDLRLQGGAASYNTANGITVAATGNVGIGWSTPLYQLHTSSPDFNLGGCLVSQIGNKYRNWNTATLKAGIYNVGGTMAYNDSNGFATFTTNVASGAYFGIAKGIEGPGYYKLYVQLAGSAGTNLTVYANGQSVVLQNVPLTTTQQGFSATLYIGLYSLVYFVCTGPSGSTFTFSDFSLVSTTLYLGAANQTITMKGSLLHMGQQFAVGGNINSFYPVFLDDPDQAYLAPYKFTIFRHNVHQDGTWTGSFNFTAEGHGSHCGNGANWYSWSYYGGPANVNNTSRSQWVARMSQDVSCGGFITVWLRGGSTYYFTGTNIRLYNVNTYGWALEHDSVTYPILTGPDAPLDQVVAAYDSRTWIMNSNRNINLGGSLSVNYAANSTEGYVNINNSTDRVALMITGGVFGTPVNNAATNTVKNNVLLRYRAYGGDYYNSNYLDIRARPHIGGWGPANAAAMFQFCCSTEAGASNSWGQWADSIPMVVSGRSGGQIGMGTEDPAYRLHVNNGSTGGPVCFLQASGVANESNTSLLIGKSLTTKFCGTILWNQKSDTYPNQNFLGFGLYGDDNVIQINGVQVNIVKPTYIAGSMCPYYDNSYTCGAGGLRWSQVWSVNGSIQTSDSNLKHAKPLPYGLRELLQVRTIKFKWKKQDELAADHPEKNFEYFGFCADELHPLFPELVYNEDPKVPIQMNYAELLPVVVNAMKEQQGMINEQVKVIKEQATTIQSLQQRLAKLEQVVSQLVR